MHVVIAMLEDPTLMMMEWFPIDQQLRSERDERVSHQVEANKQLMRNLAHEIKNPLGGIRGQRNCSSLSYLRRACESTPKSLLKNPIACKHWLIACLRHIVKRMRWSH